MERIRYNITLDNYTPVLGRPRGAAHHREVQLNQGGALGASADIVDGPRQLLDVEEEVAACEEGTRPGEAGRASSEDLQPFRAAEDSQLTRVVRCVVRIK